MTTPTLPANLLASLLALVELSKKATHGELEAVLAEGIPCVGTVLADESGGKGFIIGEGWSMEDCEFAAAACNFIRKHEHDLLEALAAHRGEAVGEVVRSSPEVMIGRIYDQACVRTGDKLYTAPPQVQAGAGDAVERLHRYANTEGLSPGQKDRLLAIVVALEVQPWTREGVNDE